MVAFRNADPQVREYPQVLHLGVVHWIGKADFATAVANTEDPDSFAIEMARFRWPRVVDIALHTVSSHPFQRVVCRRQM